MTNSTTPVGEAYDAESDALAALFGDLLCIATRAGKPPLPILQPDVRAINRAIDTITKLRQERDSALSEIGEIERMRKALQQIYRHTIVTTGIQYEKAHREIHEMARPWRADE